MFGFHGYFGTTDVNRNYINFKRATKNDVKLTDLAGTSVRRNGVLLLPWPSSAGWTKQAVALKNSYTRTNGLTMAAMLRSGDVQANDGTNSYNLAIGWNTSQNPASPTTTGNSVMVFNASTGNTAYFGFGATTNTTDVLRQITFYVMVVLRSTGAVYYVGATTAGAVDLPAYPNVRPIWLDTANTDSPVYPFIAVEPLATPPTVIYGIGAEIEQNWNQWYGSATAAATLTGIVANLVGTNPDAKSVNAWTSQGSITFQSDSGGAYAASGEGGVLTDTGAVMGMIRLDLVTDSTPTNYISIFFRYQDASHYHRIYIGATGTIYNKNSGSGEVLVTQSGAGGYLLAANSTQTLIVLDSGNYISFYLNTTKVFNASFNDTAFNTATICGINSHSSGTHTKMKNFEAHAQNVALPTNLRISAPYARQGVTTIATDTFGGTTGQDIAGHTTTTGGLTWTNHMTGSVQYAGSNTAKIVSSPTGDADYTVPLTTTTFADAQITSRAGTVSSYTGAHFFAGLLFWQDSNNYLYCRTFIDQSQTNASEIETWIVIGGAAAQNGRVQLGTALGPNITTTLRMSFDGQNFAIWMNGTEPMHVDNIVHYTGYTQAFTINAAGFHVTSLDVGSILSSFTLMQ